MNTAALSIRGIFDEDADADPHRSDDMFVGMMPSS